MPLNSRGLNNPQAISRFSLHSQNPGLGLTPAAGELTGAPYTRQNGLFGSYNNGVAKLNNNVVFSLSTSTNQNVQFVGLWNSSNEYLGYVIPSTPYNFTEPSSSRTFTLSNNSEIVISNA